MLKLKGRPLYWGYRVTVRRGWGVEQERDGDGVRDGATGLQRDQKVAPNQSYVYNMIWQQTGEMVGPGRWVTVANSGTHVRGPAIPPPHQMVKRARRAIEKKNQKHILLGKINKRNS